MTRQAKSEQALHFNCPSCNATPGQPCLNWRGQTVLSHRRRITQASGTDWGRRPELDNYSGSIDELIDKLQGAKAAGFSHVFLDSGVAPIYARVR